MRTTTIFVIILATLVLVAASAADSRAMGGADPVPAAMDTATTRERDDDGFGLHFQVGMFTHLTTNIEGQDKANYLVTGDLVGLNWSRTSSTLGLGLHFTFDENGHRLGVKGLWRTPLVRGKDAYFQFAPGVYVSSTMDHMTLSTPGYFLEAELGLTEWFALAGAVEVLPYTHRDVGFDQERFETIYEDGTAVSTYLGAKIGQWPGLGAAVLGAVVGGIVVAVSMQGFME